MGIRYLDLLSCWYFSIFALQISNLPSLTTRAHGLSSNKSMSLATYVEAFVSIRYVCLVFDYRRWGLSDGIPRDVLRVQEQLDGYRTVIKYARQQAEFDPHRVVVIYEHAIYAFQPSVNAFAVIAQCPYTGTMPLFDAEPVYIPVGTQPGRVGVMTTPGSEDGLWAICPEQRSIPRYKPYSRAADIQCPILVVAPLEDNLCTMEGIHKIKNTSRAEVFETVKAGHFEVYPGQLYYDASIVSQITFLRRNVPV
ncbi:Alpha/Beta hydrolase protein [Crucibulum laeve]|uniref:Alpha/Beta hydrolase protein n=1 Tax=Crucibulum laeve TaxID=68775 RepID=A0A5C3LQL2_9AGAR|nr:Alpha/Beta hydrolase protein [Crucibulum laeve]